MIEKMGEGPSSFLSKLLLLHDPFDDPFFRSSVPSQISSLFDNSPFLSVPSQARRHDVRIEEVSCEGPSSRRAPSPIVEHPDEDGHLGSKWMQLPSLAKDQGAFTFSSSSVRFDGPQGAYYAATKTRRGCPQGVVEEQFEEQDSRISKHTKRISRGLKDKGHSFTCQKNTKTGEIKETEYLHNLGKDEVRNFDNEWEKEAKKYLPRWQNGKSLTHGKLKELQGGRFTKALPARSQNE